MLLRVLETANERKAQILLLCGLAIWFCVDVGPRAQISESSIHRSDLSVYTLAGAALLDGESPYEVSNPRGWHYLYPPMFAVAISPLSLLSPSWQACVWFAVSVALCCGCYFECGELLRRFFAKSSSISQNGSSADTSRAQLHVHIIGLFVWLFACLPVLNTLQRGQVGLAVLYPLLLAMRLLLTVNEKREDRTTGGWRLFCVGILLSVPVVIKLTPALPVGFLVLQQFARAFWLRSQNARTQAIALCGGGILGLMLFLFVIPSAVVGWSANIKHLAVWNHRVVQQADVGGTNAFDVLSPRNQCLSNAVLLASCQFTGSNPEQPRGRQVHAQLRPVLWSVRLLLLVGLLAVGLSRESVTKPQLRMAMFGLSCAVSLLVSPLSWGHHFTICVPAVLGVCCVLPRGRLWLGIAPAVLCGVHYLDVVRFGCAGVLGIGIALWFVGALWVVYRRQPEFYGRTVRNDVPTGTKRRPLRVNTSAS